LEDNRDGVVDRVEDIDARALFLPVAIYQYMDWLICRFLTVVAYRMDEIYCRYSSQFGSYSIRQVLIHCDFTDISSSSHLCFLYRPTDPASITGIIALVSTEPEYTVWLISTTQLFRKVYVKFHFVEDYSKSLTNFCL